MNSNLLINLAGWPGAFLLLLAWFLVSSRRLAGDSFAYQILNLLGSGLLLTNAYHFGAYPSPGVNFIWVGIALFTLVKSQAKNKKEG